MPQFLSPKERTRIEREAYESTLAEQVQRAVNRERHQATQAGTRRAYADAARGVRPPAPKPTTAPEPAPQPRPKAQKAKAAMATTTKKKTKPTESAASRAARKALLDCLPRECRDAKTFQEAPLEVLAAIARDHGTRPMPEAHRDMQVTMGLRDGAVRGIRTVGNRQVIGSPPARAPRQVATRAPSRGLPEAEARRMREIMGIATEAPTRGIETVGCRQVIR